MKQLPAGDRSTYGDFYVTMNPDQHFRRKYFFQKYHLLLFILYVLFIIMTIIELLKTFVLLLYILISITGIYDSIRQGNSFLLINRERICYTYT